MIGYSGMADHMSSEHLIGCVGMRRLRLMKPDDPSAHVSHETIYAAIYAQPRGGLKAAMIEALRQAKPSYCQIWCLRRVGHAAIWSGFVASIPSLNVTPVMTLAR